MASRTRAASAAQSRGADAVTSAGQARECARYRNELARHRVVTADGADYVVATTDERHLDRGFTTAAFPVSRGYLVMMRQPLCVLSSAADDDARAQHALLVRVLVEAGTAVVRARRRSAIWRQAERSARSESAEAMPRIDLSDLTAPVTSRRPANLRA
jgi:hypothetical protein